LPPNGSWAARTGVARRPSRPRRPFWRRCPGTPGLSFRPTGRFRFSSGTRPFRLPAGTFKGPSPARTGPKQSFSAYWHHSCQFLPTHVFQHRLPPDRPFEILPPKPASFAIQWDHLRGQAKTWQGQNSQIQFTGITVANFSLIMSFNFTSRPGPALSPLRHPSTQATIRLALPSVRGLPPPNLAPVPAFPPRGPFSSPLLSPSRPAPSITVTASPQHPRHGQAPAS
jgi:hypothetical protein